MHRIVLDANILVSAFLTPGGESYALLRQVQQRELCLSPYILLEVWRTLHSSRLRKKYHYPDSEIENYIKELALTSNLIDPKVLVDVCTDPNDNAVLACAVEAQSKYLATRNIKDFPKTYEGVTILQPSELLKVLNE